MKKITIWSKFNTKFNKFEHNHIEDGHVKDNMPIAKFSNQKGWESSIWKKEFGYLDGTTITIENMK